MVWSQLSAAARQSHGQFTRAGTCGAVRRPVKTLTDRNAAGLPTVPVSTTVGVLAGLRRPAGAAQAYGRLPPVETTLWRTRALLQGYALEFDGDIHLLLRDPQTFAPMIGEIPSPSCSRPAYAAAFATARQVVQQLGHHSARLRRVWWLDYRGRHMPLVEVWGYGFWDDEHGQRGAAPNYVEIHPVMRVVAL